MLSKMSSNYWFISRQRLTWRMAGSFHWLASYSAINDVSWEVNESGDQEQVATA
jgi:hypothetical protein